MCKLPCASGTCGRRADGTCSQYVKHGSAQPIAPSCSGCSKGNRHPPASLSTGRLCAERDRALRPSIGRPPTKHPTAHGLGLCLHCAWQLKPGANWPNKLSQLIPHSPLPRARHPAGLPHSDVVCLARRGCFYAAHARIAAMMEAGRISVAGSSRGGKASVPCCR